MEKPLLSAHYRNRQPSDIRMAQIEYMKRTDGVGEVNTAIGNVSLPMHPAMRRRMEELSAAESPFSAGVVKYSATVGFAETQKAFLNIIASSGFNTASLSAMITDGGSHAMELVIVGLCGAAGTAESPLLLIDAAYTNYHSMAKRTGRKSVSVQRTLQSNGKFTLPDIAQIEQVIEKNRPNALVVIPYDNPTGHFYDHATMITLAQLCVKYNMWMVSDEAYRELYYVDQPTTSIWGITDQEVPGIEGRRISIETASKVWNACGLRVGALISDNSEFIVKAVAENTANLCPNVIGQYIFGSLAHESHEGLRIWYAEQRQYYAQIAREMAHGFHTLMPKAILSSPDASIYAVIDVRELVGKDFDAQDFVMFCAREGKVTIDGETMTLLVAPMAGFYSVNPGETNPGKTQMRIAYVESPEKMRWVPQLFAALFNDYLNRK